MPQTILIVEDNEDTLFLLAMQLRRGGYTVMEAWDGMGALEQLKDNQPDLILLDLMMPGPSGFEVLGQIRTDAELARVPVIVLSALAEPDIIKLCIELGAHDYITKPYACDDLLNRISSVLGSVRPAEPDRRA
jgi:DNA-binding response OmpR family regulator